MPVYYLRAPRPIPELLGVTHRLFAPMLSMQNFQGYSGHFYRTMGELFAKHGSVARAAEAAAQQSATPLFAFCMEPGEGGWRRNREEGKARFREYLLTLGYTEDELDTHIASLRGTPENSQDGSYPSFQSTDYGVWHTKLTSTHWWEHRAGVLTLPGIHKIESL